MEWVEITARTVEEARDIAFDQLGIDEHDAEVEVLEEPRPGLFGRLRGQARIRARVKPTAPRPKVERRPRKKSAAKSAPAVEAKADDSPDETVAVADVAAEPAPAADRARQSTGRGRRSGGAAASAAPRTRKSADRDREEPMSDLSIDEQADVVADFLRGLATEFGVPSATTSTERVEEDTVEIRLDGGDLGLLIGQRGDTLQAVQELARTVVQRRGGGTQEGRVRIDIAGYRQRRRTALERFTQQVAASVVETGTRKALEPMNAADRKVVHDAVHSIDGVRTISEGEEPRRRVVLLPED